MFSHKLIFALIFSLLVTPSFSFANNKEPKISLGILNGYQFYFKNYMQQYRLIAWDGHISTLQQSLSKHKKPIDFLLLSKNTAEQACNLGLLIPISDDLLSSENKQCAFQTFTDHITLAWDSQKLHFNPSWKDFWNVTQYPGKRGLQKDAFSALSIALLADGVPDERIVEVLSTPSGVLRAFKKLNQLRPYIVWWTTPNDANFLLYKNQVLMTSASALSMNAFQKNYPSLNFKMQNQNTVESIVVLGIPATIKTQRIMNIKNLLKKHPFPFLFSSNSQSQTWKTNIEQDAISSQDFSNSLDEIFDEWLKLTKR